MLQLESTNVASIKQKKGETQSALYLLWHVTNIKHGFEKICGY